MRKTLMSLVAGITLVAGCSTDSREYWKQLPSDFYRSLIGKNYSTNQINKLVMRNYDQNNQ